MTKQSTPKKKPIGGKRRPKDAAVFDRADDNWYVDPPSVAEALFRVERFSGWVSDPCCGMGNILRMASRAGYGVTGFDRTPRAAHFKTMTGVLHQAPVDFLSGDADRFRWDNIVMNPPYGPGEKNQQRLEEQFIDRALQLARGKVAAVLRLAWLASRIEWLKSRGCIRIWAIHTRPSMLPGESLVDGEMPGGGTVDYAWFIFIRGADMAPVLDVAKRLPDLDKPSIWTWRQGGRAG